MKLVFKEFSTLNIEEHKELLEIRNSEYVRNNMKTNSIIKIENHLSWINDLKNDRNNVYFAVFEEDYIVGAIYITGIDKEKSTSFWGLYFRKEINPLISSISAILIIEKIFQEYNIKKLYAEVKKENISAYKFNITLGFKEDEILDNYYQLLIDINDWENNKNNRTIQTIKKRVDKIEYQFI